MFYIISTNQTNGKKYILHKGRIHDYDFKAPYIGYETEGIAKRVLSGILKRDMEWYKVSPEQRGINYEIHTIEQ